MRKIYCRRCGGETTITAGVFPSSCPVCRQQPGLWTTLRPKDVPPVCPSHEYLITDYDRIWLQRWRIEDDSAAKA